VPRRGAPSPGRSPLKASACCERETTGLFALFPFLLSTNIGPALVRPVLESLGASKGEGLRVIAQHRIDGADQHQNADNHAGESRRSCVRCTRMAHRGLVAGNHGPQEILTIQQRHDDDGRNVEADHCQQRPPNQFVDVFRRLTAERSRPDRDGDKATGTIDLSLVPAGSASSLAANTLMATSSVQPRLLQ